MGRPEFMQGLFMALADLPKALRKRGETRQVKVDLFDRQVLRISENI